jgi:hypothetical protein
MLVKTFGSALLGIDAIIITVEVSITKGVSFLWWAFRITP